MSPEVSIVMSVYNGERFLREAICSILEQTYSDYEYIIVDDGSTDNTASIVASIADQRIRLIHNEKNIGLAASLNRGISLAQGRFIARMDADDISLPERLARQIEAFQENPGLDLVACAFRYIDESGKILRQVRGLVNDLYRLWTLQFHNVYIHSSIMFRKDNQISYYYDEKIKTAQDYNLWCRIAKKCNTKYLDIPLVYYRVSPQQISQSRLAEQKNSAQITSFQNLRLCNPRLNQFEIQNVYRLYNSGHITLKDVKFIPTLFRTLLGFFQRYKISIRERVSLTLLVSKDVLYWFRRSYFSH